MGLDVLNKNKVVRVSLTIALAVVGLLAFCMLIFILGSIMWASPIG